MRNRALMSAVAGVAMACGSGDSRPSGPLGTIAEVFGATPEEPQYVFGPPTPPAFSGSPTEGPGLYPSVPTGLVVEGHLEGQLRDMRLSGDTTENYGTHESWPNGGGYLNTTIAMATPSGAGMIILNVNGGMNHPVFTEGRWSSDQAAALAGPDYTGEQLIQVTSCAGPELGNYPYEQQAVDYDMTVETDPADPSTVVVVVGASFLVNEQSSQTSDLTATVRFNRPE